MYTLYNVDGYRTIENVPPFWAERLRKLKINKELTTDPKNTPKTNTMGNEFTCNVVKTFIWLLKDSCPYV